MVRPNDISVSTISIDWEDFAQLYAKYHYGVVTAPSPAIERQTDIILRMLDEAGIKATFFVLGMTAQYRPDLVKRIAAKGHEIALHGQNHEQLFLLSPEDIYKDLLTSKNIVENITGQRIAGYRAPIFSIIKKNLYTLDILAELGLDYDASIVPAGLSRYGIEGFDAAPCHYQLTGERYIVELPITVCRMLGRKVPISGGRYLRMLPPSAINRIFTRMHDDGQDTMIYMHPYEFDTEKLDVSENYPEGVAYSKMKVRVLNAEWSVTRNAVPVRIKGLLKRLKFATCAERAAILKDTPAVPLKLLQGITASSS